MITVECPIYWEKLFKTKPSKTYLVGMNWFRNAHHFDQNKFKQDFHQMIIAQLGLETISGPYLLDIELYYKNSNSDGSNIIALVEKVVLDAFQGHGTIPNDTVKFHLGTTWKVVDQDKSNPRCRITLKEFLT